MSGSRQVINQRNYRKRNFDNLKCIYCGKSSVAYACDSCRRWHNAQTVYMRWFKKLFT